MNKAILASVKTGNTFEVQYNPVTLRLEKGASLSFELIFDNQGDRDVQSTVQGFMGMLASEEGRHVIFYWGDMSYPGEVTQMRASYEYFSAQGVPLRAKINMTIMQTGDCGGNQEYWERAYNAF